MNALSRKGYKASTLKLVPQVKLTPCRQGKEGQRWSVLGKVVQQGVLPEGVLVVLNALSRKGQKASALKLVPQVKLTICKQGRKSKEGQFLEKSFNRKC